MRYKVQRGTIIMFGAIGVVPVVIPVVPVIMPVRSIITVLVMILPPERADP